MEKLSIDALIPHRERMKLIGKILSVDKDTAMTETVLTQDSPLISGNYANPLILVELAAQTAGVCIGYQEYQKTKTENKGKGWLVGVKQVSFYLDQIPLNTTITTFSRNAFNFENFMEISAVSTIAGQMVSEIILQVAWS